MTSAARASTSATRPQLELLQGGGESREVVLARRFAQPMRCAEATVGLALTALSERGVDLAAEIRSAGWALGPDGLWRLPGHRGGRSLVEALGAECGRRLPDDLAWWRALQQDGSARYRLAFGAHACPVSAGVAPEVAAALLRILDFVLARHRARHPRLCPPASEARRRLDALARRGLPAAAPTRRAPGPGLGDAPSYLRAFGTAAE